MGLCSNAIDIRVHIESLFPIYHIDIETRHKNVDGAGLRFFRMRCPLYLSANAGEMLRDESLRSCDKIQKLKQNEPISYGFDIWNAA